MWFKMIWSVLLPIAIGILSYVLMLAAVGNLSYANCLKKWHVELFMFYELSMC
jgi:hypothetical protein